MTTPTDDIEALVEDEWYVVRYSGEIPEVAYHGAVFHLTRAANGPRIDLSRRQRDRLLEAVTQRYLEITLRDLLPENKEKLVAILTYHVVAGKVMSTDLSDGMMAATVEGSEITVDLSDGVKIDGHAPPSRCASAF